MTDLITQNESGEIQINSEALKLENLTQDDQIKYLNRAMEQILTNQGEQLIKASQVDMKRQVKLWLDKKESKTDSKHTRNTYERAYADLKEFLDGLGVHPLMLTAEKVDRYQLHLSDCHSANGVRVHMSACSSLYSMLKRYKHITENPFHGAKLPKKTFKKAVVTEDGEKIPVMSTGELGRIEDALRSAMETTGAHIGVKRKAEGARRFYPALYFMCTYGLRAGAIQTIQIEGDSFTYETKGGKRGRRELTEESKALLIGEGNRPFAKYAKRTMQGAMGRFCKEVGLSYSCHDCRHYFAIEHYKKHKDIYVLSKLLDHASFNITQIYLQGLDWK